MMTDYVYRHVLGTSPGFDWRKLRDTVAPGQWHRMCELALIVNRYAGGYGLPLANEGEYALLRWLANFDSAEQVTARSEASKNLGEAFEASKSLAEAVGMRDRYEGYHVELQRCLDPDKQWRPGPWAVAALDQLCREALTAYQAAVEPTTEVMGTGQLPLPLLGEDPERETASTVTDPVATRKRPGPRPGESDVIRQQRRKLITQLRRLQRGNYKNESNSQTLDRFLGANKGYKLPGAGDEKYRREQLLREWGKLKSK
jgi:hypothetical protein